MSSKSIWIVVAAVAATLSWQTAPAQTTRAEIKADTRAAEKAGKLTPAGEAANPTIAPASGPRTTRAERKAAALAARKAGKLTPAGEAANPTIAPASGPRTTRAERKAETLDAKKKGELVPAGQGSPSDVKK